MVDWYLGGRWSKIALVTVSVCLAASAALLLCSHYPGDTGKIFIPGLSQPDSKITVQESETVPLQWGHSLIVDLAPDLLPQTGKSRVPGRLVVVGDVHGMKDELEDLLSKIGFNKHDRLILAGDMISKGPDSPGVIDLAMKLKALCVKGNHEENVLRAAENLKEFSERSDGVHDGLEHQKGDHPLDLGQIQAGETQHPSDIQTTSKNKEDVQSQDNSKDKKNAKLARQLGRKRLDWIRRLPIILRIGKLSPMGEFLVVHGGLEPGKKLRKQDLTAVLNMRSIKHNGKPSKERDGEPWFELWNKYQKTLPKAGRVHVIYGHDSGLGFQEKRWTHGLDSGCVNGGKLTAMVIVGGEHSHSYTFESVQCRRGARVH